MASETQNDAEGLHASLYQLLKNITRRGLYNKIYHSLRAEERRRYIQARNRGDFPAYELRSSTLAVKELYEELLQR